MYFGYIVTFLEFIEDIMKVGTNSIENLSDIPEKTVLRV